MTALGVAGSVGFGLIWGWLLAERGRFATRPLRLVMASALALLLMAIEVAFLTSTGSIVWFAGGALAGAFLNLAWIGTLRQRTREMSR